MKDGREFMVIKRCFQEEAHLVNWQWRHLVSCAEAQVAHYPKKATMFAVHCAMGTWMMTSSMCIVKKISHPSLGYWLIIHVRFIVVHNDHKKIIWLCLSNMLIVGLHMTCSLNKNTLAKYFNNSSLDLIEYFFSIFLACKTYLVKLWWR